MKKAYIPFSEKVGYTGLVSPSIKIEDGLTKLFKLNFLLDVHKIRDRFKKTFDNSWDFGFVDQNGVEYWVQTFEEKEEQETYVTAAYNVYTEVDIENFTSWLEENFELKEEK